MISSRTYRYSCGCLALTYRHQNDGIDTQSPLLREHDFHLAPEDTCGDAFVSSSFSVTELLRLGEPDTYKTYANRETRGDPLFYRKVSAMQL